MKRLTAGVMLAAAGAMVAGAEFFMVYPSPAMFTAGAGAVVAGGLLILDWLEDAHVSDR